MPYIPYIPIRTIQTIQAIHAYTVKYISLHTNMYNTYHTYHYIPYIPIHTYFNKLVNISEMVCPVGTAFDIESEMSLGRFPLVAIIEIFGIGVYWYVLVCIFIYQQIHTTT